MKITPKHIRSRELYDRAKQLIPGGVNSPVRAFRAVGIPPLFLERGQGSKVIDVDGNHYVDYIGEWGPLILGHAHPDVERAIREATGTRDGLWSVHGSRDPAGTIDCGSYPVHRKNPAGQLRDGSDNERHSRGSWFYRTRFDSQIYRGAITGMSIRY